MTASPQLPQSTIAYVRRPLQALHIADVTLFYAPHGGGVRTYLQAKHQRLAQRPGIRHSLVIPGQRTTYQDSIYELAAPPIPFYQGYRFPLNLRSWVNAITDLKPNIIEAGDPYLPAWAALQAARRLAVPAIGMYHSNLPQLLARRIGQPTTPLLERYVRRLYNQFDRVLAPSQVIADSLTRLGVDHVQVQPLGVDTDVFHPARRDPALREQLGLADDDHLLIFAGRAACEKNLPLLFSVLQRLGSRYHLLLVGNDMPRKRPENVQVWPGFADHQTLARLLASADALVHAGTQETFGLVVIEAMASGIPVVGMRAGAVAELVQPGTGLLATPNDPTDFAAKVIALFGNGHREMGAQARRHVERHYSWDEVMAQLLGHYRELTGIHYELTPDTCPRVSAGTA